MQRGENSAVNNPCPSPNHVPGRALPTCPFHNMSQRALHELVQLSLLYSNSTYLSLAGAATSIKKYFNKE